MAPIEEEGAPIADDLDNVDKDTDAEAPMECPLSSPPNNDRRLFTATRRKMGLLILLILAIIGGTYVAVVMLVDSDASNTEVSSGNDPDQALEDTRFPRIEPTFPPTFKPTLSAAPSFTPSSLPSMAPTVPQMGCRRDRFDNEGNREENNHLFAGSYVCSDDADKRYMFGIDPDTANLIWRDSLTGQVKTYYWNEWHRLYLEAEEKMKEENEKKRQLAEAYFFFEIPKNATSFDSTAIQHYQLSENYTVAHSDSCVEWYRHTNEDDEFHTFYMIHYNCTEKSLERQFAIINKERQLNDKEPLVFEEGRVALAVEDGTDEPTASPSFVPTYVPSRTPSNVPWLTNAPSAPPSSQPSPQPSVLPTREPTTSPTIFRTAELTVLDYFFTLSTTGAFRMWRVQRTEDYQIVQKTLHWELPSLFHITTVYEDCLKTHDCPYLHLHQDGVMVLAWLDFENSEYYDGWMEKNIRRCYTFNTTDSL
jgi:hypothetical protein